MIRDFGVIHNRLDRSLSSDFITCRRSTRISHAVTPAAFEKRASERQPQRVTIEYVMAQHRAM